MTDEEKRDQRRKYQQAYDNYNFAKRQYNACESEQSDCSREKHNLEMRLEVVKQNISALRNDLGWTIVSANQAAATADSKYHAAIREDASQADVERAFHLDTNLDDAVDGLDAERRRLENEIERLRVEISNLNRKIDEYSSQMTYYRRLMNQYN